MKFHLLTAVAVACAVMVTADDSIPETSSSYNELATQTCTPHTQVRKECNTCVCVEDGSGYFCTKKGCRSRQERDTATATIAELATQPCTAGTQVQKDCNTCTCGKNGDGYFCTRRVCGGETRKRRDTTTATIAELATQPCTAGTQVQKDCNTCTCGKNGDGYFCTRRVCGGETRKRREVDLAVRPCTPGTQVQQECNTCTCGARGDGYQCTRMACPPTRRRRDEDASTQGLGLGSRCTPGAQWKVDCNDCHCTSNRIAACTQRGCLH